MKRSILLCLLALSALAEPPVSTQNKTTIPNALVVVRDAGSAQFPLYVVKGQDMSSGTQSVGICMGGAVSIDGTSCTAPDNRYQYVVAHSDARLHVRSDIANDSLGTLDWLGSVVASAALESELVGATGPAFKGSGTSAYGIMGTGTIAALPASSGTTTGAHTFVTDAGRPAYNQGTGWYYYAGLSDLRDRDYLWTASCHAGITVGCANEDSAWNAGHIPVSSNVTVGNITCGWEVDGVNGAGSGAAVVGIYRTSGTPAYVCSCTYGGTSCDDGPNAPLTCNGCSGTTLVAGDTYVMRWHTDSDCTTMPTVTTCNIPLTAAAY